MRITAVLCVVALVACGRGSSVEGAWQSDREVTLGELRQANFTPEQWRFLSSPDVFGKLVYVFHHGSLVTVYDGECSEPEAYSVDRASGRVRLASEPGMPLTLEGGYLRAPIAQLPGKRETFSRIDLDAAVRRHPCVGSFVRSAR